jgi:XTP/dITP diphosphohydrolase
MDKLLSLLREVPRERRTARFVCCLCLASPEKVLIETQGTVEGLITEAPAGTGGFGYDPVFLVPQLGQTIAQLGDEEKNAISHRGNAMRRLKPLLDELLNAAQSLS